MDMCVCVWRGTGGGGRGGGRDEKRTEKIYSKHNIVVTSRDGNGKGKRKPTGQREH